MRRLRETEVKKFRRAVYEYYRERGRADLPWRRTRDPYRILVSEFMLQQTQVPRVLEKYEQFIARFPDIAALAGAPLRDVLREWSGLGYNRRALHLKRAAQRIVKDFGGTIPPEPAKLVTLPGIGKATAAAIAAFAFGAAHPFVETNIRAVFIHHFFPDRTRVPDAELLQLVEQTLDRAGPRAWYSALMDYGSMLKSRLPNPSRRSAHHARQGPFEGSDRQARGLIVKALAKRDLAEAELRRVTGLDASRLRRNLGRLVDEGMVTRKRRRYGIAP
ncbi:MAG TPA: A/G-specific adenine glycosylase [Patescibacteria group bacterium]|nr:A/G-specific adenine glycosylase [Patescibacteria group bacterium]